jgi:hypothetical protein
MGSMIGGIGTIYSGIKGATDAQASAQAEWNANDALAQYGARNATLKGTADASNARALGAQVQAGQKVAYTNSGVDSTVGTAAAVQADTAGQSELDAQTAKNNAARQAWGFKVQQEQAAQTYRAKVASAQNQGTASVLSGAGQLIGGAGGMFG